MYTLIKPLLFSMNAESAHDLTLASLAVAGNSGLLKPVLPASVDDPIELMGCRFANRVGLAAGLDKNARCVRGMAALGFGFIEVGTVTPLAQPGNDKPRMFRLPEHKSIINRMGFNNDGLVALVKRVEALRSKALGCPLGINIGKNKVTAAEHAANDYLMCLSEVAPLHAAGLADYVTINLSSPNTPGLRDLQFGNELNQLLTLIADKRKQLANEYGKAIPLLVKIAPDMARDDLLAVAEQLIHHGIDGVIATNTTIDKSAVADSPHASEAGGLSGAVLFERSTDVVATLAQAFGNALVIIGVGGINSAEQAVAKIAAGADLVQLYSGLIYQGPGLVHASAQAIKNHRAAQ